MVGIDWMTVARVKGQIAFCGGCSLVVAFEKA